MSQFTNQVVWITGASSGIGEALAYAFAKQGAKLVLSARRESELERVKNACTGAKSVMILPLDLASGNDFKAETEQVLQAFGQIDILVNNGGISQRGLAKDTLMDVDRRIMEVNFFGAIALTKAVLPTFLQQKKGQIVVISSIVGKIGVPLRTAYSASKHALHGWFDALRAETWQANLKVLLACPGYVQTQVSVNALSGDGSKHNKMDETTSQGLTADYTADQILKAIQKGKAEVIISGSRERLGIFLKRFFPARLRKMLQTAKTT
jgi:dehydrogenase/reductase SDR family member 7B